MKSEASDDTLAREISSIDPPDQHGLVERVAKLNFLKGLHDLAEKYRSRLASEGRLNIPAAQVWAELHLIREEIAAQDYPS